MPEHGGDTEYVSARAAYSRLSSEVRELIEPLEVIHDYVFSRSKVADVDPAHAASLPPVYQKLVRKNPANKEKELLYWISCEIHSGLGRRHGKGTFG